MVLLWTPWSIPTEEVTISTSARPPPSGGEPALVRRSVSSLPGELEESEEERSLEAETRINKSVTPLLVNGKIHCPAVNYWFFCCLLLSHHQWEAVYCLPVLYYADRRCWNLDNFYWNIYCPPAPLITVLAWASHSVRTWHGSMGPPIVFPCFQIFAIVSTNTNVLTKSKKI